MVMNMETTYIQTDIKHVRRFLDACDGNWHHCIHVTCPSCKTSGICSEPGFLFHPDATSEPLILPLSDARILFSCYPEPEECISNISVSAFLSLYRSYLNTKTAVKSDCPCMELLKMQEEKNYDW